MPRWALRWPERLQHELDALRRHGADPQVDQAILDTHDVVSIALEWALDGRKLPLQATFPDTFPHTRPEVYAPTLGPGRHIHPLSRGLCLLRRGTHNWRSTMTLADLLATQLPKIIAANANPGNPDEEPVGEPAEEWWNGLGLRDSYCLVDSDWKVDSAIDHGTLVLKYQLRKKRSVVRIRAYVDQVRGPDKTVLQSWTAPLPPDLRNATAAITIPWARLSIAPLPTSVPIDLRPFAEAHPSFKLYREQSLQCPDARLRGTLRCLLYPSEITYQQNGLGWLILFGYAEPQRHEGVTVLLRPLRAGARDLGLRVPSVAALHGKRILVIGLGAIGAPIAIDLARNGCSDLRLLEPDIVEPGITVRWPLGAAYWGQAKLLGVEEFVRQNYPGTEVQLVPIRVGGAPPIAELGAASPTLKHALAGADLVIDATAEEGVTAAVDDLCRELKTPLIKAYATPALTGGVVARFDHGRKDACSTCLDWAWHDGALPSPPGLAADDASAVQPPGCADVTFTGADYDLVEISLEALRMAVATLSDSPRYPAGSRLHLLRFVDEQGRHVPPRWEVHPLAIHSSCTCHAA